MMDIFIKNYIKYPISRCELIKIMLQLSSGKFIENKNVNYVKTNFFSLDVNNGFIVVDGEKINDKNITVSILKDKYKINTFK